jgi:ferredoxin
MLALKGAKVVGITGVDMPSNWTAVHPGMQPANVEDIIERARKRVDAFAQTVLDGGTLYRGWMSLLFGLLLAPVSLGYMLLGRPLLGKLFLADERCTSCGVCVKSCPFSAIRMMGSPKPRPYWTWRCESCMRCMNVCPERAVQAWQPGLIGLFLLASTLGVPVGIALAVAGIPRGGVAGLLVSESLSLAALFLSWAALYTGLWWMTRSWPLAWLMGHSTFTRIYRRYHEPDTDLRKV